mgnify:CR=1 FL=1
MVVHNVTCNLELEVEKKCLEGIDEKLDDLLKPEKIIDPSSLKLNLSSPPKRSIYALHYKILDQNAVEKFIYNVDKILKEKIIKEFGEAVLNFSSQLEIMKEYK